MCLTTTLPNDLRSYCLKLIRISKIIPGSLYTPYEYYGSAKLEDEMYQYPPIQKNDFYESIELSTRLLKTEIKMSDLSDLKITPNSNSLDIDGDGNYKESISFENAEFHYWNGSSQIIDVIEQMMLEQDIENAMKWIFA